MWSTEPWNRHQLNVPRGESDFDFWLFWLPHFGTFSNEQLHAMPWPSNVYLYQSAIAEHLSRKMFAIHFTTVYPNPLLSLLFMQTACRLESVLLGFYLILSFYGIDKCFRIYLFYFVVVLCQLILWGLASQPYSMPIRFNASVTLHNLKENACVLYLLIGIASKLKAKHVRIIYINVYYNRYTCFWL